ncbi:NADH:flavin oxidoreductase/NADH oxidase [hydrothermal vent metagenome]|uniref:NADH:flavin oxidoreductase/NADH oxidase n=1 Tax=hydrothermal vent metagenome TaxID=652676 RepID=A0A3B0WMP9_9ZZZZ
MKIFEAYDLSGIKLKNRLVMSPMTRSRAVNNIPNDLMAKYYSQRAGAGLIITEGVAPSANGLGYPRIPGIYNQKQIQGWKKITDAVHEKGGKIFIQLMHTGRVSHPENMEENTTILAPSAIAAAGEMYTDSKGMQPLPVPKEITLKEIEQAQLEYVKAAENAITAGFDGVELHGANGYLIDQFINTGSNTRTDVYGGNMVNRCRFAIEVAQKVVNAIGENRTGIRLSPYGTYNDMALFDGMENTFEYLAEELAKLRLSYAHIVDHSSQGAPEVTDTVKRKIQKSFGGNIIASGGLDKEKAELILEQQKGDLVAFGQAFLANPDLVNKFKNNLPLNSPNYDFFFTPGEKGYTDYPFVTDK